MSTVVPAPIFAGRYAIFDRIAAGGMAAVHVARLVGEGGFARTVAVKRLHPQFALDPEFVAMFLDEARLAARIRHPNVVPTMDIVSGEGELFLVMEYVDGEPFSMLLRLAHERGERAPVAVAAGVVAQTLVGLQAAHDAKSDLGEPLHIVHRDVSPQNVLVGTDGVARVLDFGVAKALGKLHTTREGQLKGKLGYLAPEQVLGHPVTARTDVFAAAVVLWEALAGQRLFAAESEGNVLRRIMEGDVDPPGAHAPEVPRSLEAVVMKGLAKEPADRYETAMAMAEAIEAATETAPPRAIGSWVLALAGQRLRARAQLLAAVESSSPVPSAAAAATVDALPTRVDVEPPAMAGAPMDREPAQTSISVASDRPRSSGRPSAASVAVAALAIAGGLATAFLVGRSASRLEGSSGSANAASLAGPASAAASLPPATSASAQASASEPAAATAPASPPASASPVAPAPARAPGRQYPRVVPSSKPRPSGTVPAAAMPQGTGIYTRE
jgi:serine/threonine-protein kinase